MYEARGFPCPACAEPVRVDIGRLLGGGPFFCGGCGLRLEVDRAASAGAMEGARLYEDAMRKVEASGVLHPDPR
jgi:hypothetical protein